jgi:hypothetical protein
LMKLNEIKKITGGWFSIDNWQCTIDNEGIEGFQVLNS